jgi:hypothetical protein
MSQIILFNIIINLCVKYILPNLAGDQLDAQFFYIKPLFQSSTCFEQARAHHQEVICINTASGIVTLKTSEWSKITKYSAAKLYFVILDHSLVFRVTIPDAVLIQLTS